MPHRQLRGGFSLIEILITASIIVTISLVAVASYTNTQKKGRDQQRKADLAKIATGLQTYHARYNRFPDETFNSDGCDSSKGGGGTTCTAALTDWDAASDLRPLVTQGILRALPIDPRNVTPYFYLFELDQVSGGEGSPDCVGAADNTCRYVLQALMENQPIYGGGTGQCIYTLVSAQTPNGDVRSEDYFSGPPDCTSNIVPAAWAGMPCCDQ